MKISSQMIKFKLGILIGVICCILAPALYDLTLPSEASLIEAYNKELDLIGVDNIKGLHREGERIIKGKIMGLGILIYKERINIL